MQRYVHLSSCELLSPLESCTCTFCSLEMNLTRTKLDTDDTPYNRIYMLEKQNRIYIYNDSIYDSLKKTCESWLWLNNQIQHLSCATCEPTSKRGGAKGPSTRLPLVEGPLAPPRFEVGYSNNMIGQIPFCSYVTLIWERSNRRIYIFWQDDLTDFSFALK